MAYAIGNFKGELFMGQPIFSTGQLPTYHEGMPIVKMRSSASLRETSAANSEARSVLESPGISALSTFERAGLIKKVTPLARSIDEERSVSGAGRYSYSYRYIAKEFHLSKTTVLEIVKRSRIGDNNMC